jgi:hypothetical protein
MACELDLIKVYRPPLTERYIKSTIYLITARFIEISIINYINKPEFKEDKLPKPVLAVISPSAHINSESNPVVVQHIFERLIQLNEIYSNMRKQCHEDFMKQADLRILIC